MEVFSDYECPSCRNLFETTLRPMIADYVAAGKVYLVHRDFRLPMHKYGYEAARWVNASARVGQFQEVEATLYDNQNAWAADGNIEKYVSGAMSAADFKRVQSQMRGCEMPGTASVKPAATRARCSDRRYLFARHLHRSRQGAGQQDSSAGDAHLRDHL